ncbi:lysophospholipase L1-like esterase [Flavobacterium arsenatis]|uniref:Lysophospholipase L1-like esterase n=1 Tax=Flavobacterium arsenatis TaxID=1484332 RepID=A0ABU1TL35_9FLAO|nr:G-D-S-L family lipolytic protein [Flavobacterium arsenatis]MDR6966692.1 lysophospholipase L1-like esterase [Flavobacterium arsenatis]
MIKNIKWLFLVSLTFAACSSDDEGSSVTEQPITAGSANFSKYIALGDSFAAGYSDNALFKTGQENSYPNILAQQFALAGGGSFTTPFMNDDIGGLLFGGNVNPAFGKRIYLQGFLNATTPNIIPVPGNSTTEASTQLAGPFNNMGIPGAKSFHLTVPGYGTLNPYFGRFASSAGASVIGDAVVQDATFFSLWIGGNDVLTYASSGGTGTDQTGNLDPTTYAANDITDPMVFDNVYNGLVNALTVNGAKGVVANLPYINTLPYFTTVPYNPVPPLPAENAAQINQIGGAINQINAAMGEPARFVTLSSTANNPLLILDESLPNISAQITGVLTPVVGAQTAAFLGNLYGRARHAKNIKNEDPNLSFIDYILLPTRAIIGTNQAGIPAPFNVVGVTFPLQDGNVLTNDEAGKIKVATDAYNITIQNAAEAKGLAFVDTKVIMNQLLNGGIRFGNHHVTAAYITGGAFSLDGIHPSARGYSLIANKFLEAIAQKYGSSIPAVNMGSYPIQYPVTMN